MARRPKPEDDLAAASANPPQHIPPGPKIEFKALMPGYPSRHDGWNQPRVQRFLDTLAHTGCVKDAARVAGMSAVAARRAQKRFPLFAAAWEDALERARQGLIAIAYKRAVEGRETIIIRKGEEYQRKIEPSDSMLGLLIKRGDMSGGKLAEASEDVLTYEEWKAGWTFKQYGGKWKPPSPEEAKARLEAKFALMRKRMTGDDDGAAVGAAGGEGQAPL
jgi:flavin-binding protein dodecin